jgi:hypothetical protein
MNVDDDGRWKYGLWAVLGGAAAIVLISAVAMLRYENAADVGSAVGPAIAALGTLAGAYFGVQAGAAGKQASDASRDAAHAQALRFAAIADPRLALEVLGIPTEPTPPDDGGPGPAVAGESKGPFDGWRVKQESGPPAVNVKTATQADPHTGQAGA